MSIFTDVMHCEKHCRAIYFIADELYLVVEQLNLPQSFHDAVTYLATCYDDIEYVEKYKKIHGNAPRRPYTKPQSQRVLFGTLIDALWNLKEGYIAALASKSHYADVYPAMAAAVRCIGLDDSLTEQYSALSRQLPSYL